jgi:hypothetical protein
MYLVAIYIKLTVRRTETENVFRPIHNKGYTKEYPLLNIPVALTKCGISITRIPIKTQKLTTLLLS